MVSSFFSSAQKKITLIIFANLYLLKWRYSFLFIVIAIISYAFFSYTRFPFLNSDDALSVLMAWDYDFAKDIYCWGQNRGGTVIPAFAQLGIYFGLSPLQAVSISAFMVYTLGFLGFSTFFKSNWIKVCFALLWFLPFERFMDISRFPMGLGYSFIGIAVGFLHLFNLQQSTRKYVFLFGICLSTFFAIWLLDTAAISALLLWVFGYFGIEKDKRKIYIIAFLSTFIFIFIFVLWAKTYAISYANEYTKFNSIGEIGDGIGIIIKAWKTELVFNSVNPIVGLCAWFCLVIFCVVLFIIFKLKLINVQKIKQFNFFYFFVFDFFVMLFVFLLSAWTLANGMGRWYFVASYISGSLLCLFVIEQYCLTTLKYVPKIKFATFIVCLISSFSSFYTFGFTRNKTFKPTVESVKEWNKYAPVGIIGEYWNSYINRVANVEQIAVTANEQSDVRNRNYVDEVFKKPRLFIVKDMWMDTFPLHIKQFERNLVKKGKPFNLAGSMVCEYSLNKAKL